jgi:hypothetical protein
MRFSLSWKAYCFNDAADRERWHRHSEDLKLETVLDTLCDDLRERGRLNGARPPNRELAELLVNEYIHFPTPQIDES